MAPISLANSTYHPHATISSHLVQKPSTSRMVNRTEHKPQKREVDLRKYAREPFGADILIHNGRALIAHVEQVAKNSSTLLNVVYTSAYRSGLRWGDEISLVGGVVPASMDPEAFVSALDEPRRLKLEIIEQPLTNTYTIPGAMSEYDYLGVVYSNGHISDVIYGSTAYKAGLQAREVITSINGKSTLTLTDREVLTRLHRAFHNLDEVIVHTLDLATARELLGATLGAISRRNTGISPHILIDPDYNYDVVAARSAPAQEQADVVQTFNETSEIPNTCGANVFPVPGYDTVIESSSSNSSLESVVGDEITASPQTMTTTPDIKQFLVPLTFRSVRPGPVF
eukprot:comp4972_c0_seq1/m.1065 comp4972_c0_seq1/g.1065  ORF comp4972_c0_seq1/g.1065 comp4972_c0_seq1/m.1065 type:complete len:341 (-) comp4972_c0_seq1:502-1524(-)